MKLSSRLLGVLLFLISFWITACSQTADIYINQDETWNVKSALEFNSVESKIFQQAVDGLLKEITQQSLPPEVLQVKYWPAPALNMLKTYYANQGIEFSWNKILLIDFSYQSGNYFAILDFFDGLVGTTSWIE